MVNVDYPSKLVENHRTHRQEPTYNAADDLKCHHQLRWRQNRGLVTHQQRSA